MKWVKTNWKFRSKKSYQPKVLANAWIDLFQFLPDSYFFQTPPFCQGGAWFQQTASSFRVILSNTTILSSSISKICANKDQQTRGACQQWLRIWPGWLSRSVTRTSCASTANNEASVDAFTLNTLIAPCINEYWLPSVVVMKGACQSRA